MIPSIYQILDTIEKPKQHSSFSCILNLYNDPKILLLLCCESQNLCLLAEHSRNDTRNLGIDNEESILLKQWDVILMELGQKIIVSYYDGKLQQMIRYNYVKNECIDRNYTYKNRSPLTFFINQTVMRDMSYVTA